MSEHNYIHWPSDRGSWHVLVQVGQDGWHLRCGRLLTTEGKAATSIPVGEKTCETCAVGALRDDDEGPTFHITPLPEDETVPG